MVKSQNFLTSEGLEKLKKEHCQLKNKKLPQVVERLAIARGQGDLTENSEYAAARDEFNFISDRISELEKILKNAKTFSGKKNSDKVDLGSKVSLKINGKKETYFIVSEFESNPIEKKISFKSPIGKALIGKKVGEKIVIQAPAGRLTYQIVSIS